MCIGMLKPKRLANQSIAYTKVGERRSSVWWRNGRAVAEDQLKTTAVSIEMLSVPLYPKKDIIV